jgi:hypothetical protein
MSRPQQGFRDFRATYSVMESQILYWMMSGEDVFLSIFGRLFFPLGRVEDASYDVLFLVPPRTKCEWEDVVCLMGHLIHTILILMMIGGLIYVFNYV